MGRIGALAAVVCVAQIISHSAWAGVVTIDEDPNGNLFGTLNQRAIAACGNNTSEDNSSACGPTAAVNSFTYLQNRYPGVYGNSLTNGDPAGTANALSDPAYMNCSCVNGTGINDFITGKQRWIENHAPGRTTYETMNWYSGQPGATPPNFSFIASQLMAGEDVEVLIGFYQKDADNDWLRSGGHYLTLTGASFNDVNGNGVYDAGTDTLDSISFVDPWGANTTDPNAGIRSISGVSSVTQTVDLSPDPANGPDGTDYLATFLSLDNYFGNTSEFNGNSDGVYRDNTTYTFIEAAVAESPAPAPSALAIMGAGVLFTLGMGLRRRV